LVSEEVLEVGIAKCPRLADIGHDAKEGGKTKTRPADELEHPEGGETEMGAVKHVG